MYIYVYSRTYTFLNVFDVSKLYCLFLQIVANLQKIFSIFIENTLLISEVTQLKPMFKGQLHMPFF